MREHLSAGNALKTAAGVAVLAVLYVGVEAEQPRSGAQLESPRMQAALCADTRRAAESVPGEARDRAREAAAAACAAGFHPAPAGAPASASTAAFDPAATGTIARHGRLPFFAARAGTLPATGAATVAGIALPAGTRHQRYWIADAPTADSIALASRLARAFPRTGLWPVLWDWEDEGPEAYTNAAHTPREAARLDPLAVLNHVRYSSFHVASLAPASRLPARVPDPFAQLATAPDALESSTGQRLLLVAVHRPSDAIVQTGFAQSELLSTPAQAAVARSWERRFGATLTVMTPSSIGLAVAAPPVGAVAARRLAAEQRAYAPDDEEQTAASLRAGPARGFWSFGWPD